MDAQSGLDVCRRRCLLGGAVVALMTFAGCHAPGTSQNIAGVRFFQQHQPQAAMYEFQQALSVDPTNPDCYYNLAASYHYMGKSRGDTALMNQAETLYHQCLDLQPDHVACHRALAVLLVDTNRPRSAFTLLERWAQRSPHVAASRVELARLHEEFGEPSEARRYLAEAVDINPSDARAWTALAQLRETEGQFDLALNNYQRSYYLNNYQPAVAQRIASLQQRVTSSSSQSLGPRYADAPRGWQQR